MNAILRNIRKVKKWLKQVIPMTPFQRMERTQTDFGRTYGWKVVASGETITADCLLLS
ncbi:MAG: hypothetical protein GY757_45365 [bacterium]|nr:hypothetical protein [bacterium]